MLAKEDKKIISKIGRYKYNKMKEMNLSFEEFSKATGIAIPTIRKLENGQTDLTKIRESTRKRLKVLKEVV